MPDTKITALAAITTVDPAADVLPIVDISDTSMAASGTTKKITSNQILGAGGTATLASATITGDLTVRTNKLAVTSTGVGVNYTSPAVALHVGTTGATNKFCINTAVTNAGDIQLRRGAFIGFSNAADNTNSEYLFANGGALEMGIAGSTAMTLNATGLGVGAAPANVITARAAQDTGLELNSAASNASRLIFAYDPANTRWYINSTLSGSGTTLPLAFLIQNSEVARFNTTGNLAFANGKGIDFSAVTGGTGTATGNVLNDYEEGTFTPAITGTVTAGVGTYSNQIGRYTKVGNQVTVWIRLSWSAHTGSGDMTITGFPFTLANVNNLGAGAAIGYTANISITAGNYLMVYGDSGFARAYFWQTPTGGGSTNTVAVDPSGDIGLTMTYFV